MCSLSQLKTLWRTDLTHRVEPLAEVSSELHYSTPLTVQPEVSNAAWPKHLELTTEWKERILVVRSCKNFTVVLVIRSIEHMHHYSPSHLQFHPRIIVMLGIFVVFNPARGRIRVKTWNFQSLQQKQKVLQIISCTPPNLNNLKSHWAYTETYILLFKS